MIELKRPAYSGLEPGAVRWKAASLFQQREIGVFFDSDIEGELLKKVDTQPQELAGYYRVTGNENAFVKLLWNKNAGSHVSAEKIAAWLHGQGIYTSYVRDGFPRGLAYHPAHIFVYDFIEYHFCGADRAQLYAIGQALGEMHARLANYPEIWLVASNGRIRNGMIRGRLSYIHRQGWRCAVNPCVTKILRQTKLSDLDLMEEHAQMIHGDVNYGNVLMDSVTGRPIFIDFENAATSWLSPLYDIVFVMQRFILERPVMDKGAVMEAFVQGYRRAYQLMPSWRGDALYAMYRMIPVRAMLLLSLLRDEKQAAYKDEYEKFVWLHQSAESKRSLLNDAYKALLS